MDPKSEELKLAGQFQELLNRKQQLADQLGKLSSCKSHQFMYVEMAKKQKIEDK